MWFYTAKINREPNVAHTVVMDWSQKTRGAVVFEAVLLVALLGTIATLTNIHTQVALKKVQVAQRIAVSTNSTTAGTERPSNRSFCWVRQQSKY